MVTRALFTALLLLFGVGLLREWIISRRNTELLLGLGAHAFGGHQTRSFLVAALVWTAGALGEVWLFERAVHPGAVVVAVSLIVAGRHLRRAARRALGRRWTFDVVSLSGNPLVTGQIYDRMRHPEYTGTFLLFAGLPLLHGAWATLAGTLIVGLALLVSRVRLEEAVLDEDARYDSALGNRPRFYPRRARVLQREPSQPTRLRPNKRGDLPGPG